MRAIRDGVTIAQPDVTLVLDINGIIEKASLSGAIAGESVEDWLGRPWVETVADLGGDKVTRMVEDARQKGVSAFRQMTQRFPSGLELPMEYTAVRLGARGGLIAVGKSLRAVAELQSRLIAAQQAMERDYWKLREVETRYRRLFDASNDAVLLLKPTNLRIVEANAGAVRTLGISLTGRDERSGERDFLNRLPANERSAFESMLARVREQGRAPGIVAHIGRERKSVMIRASLMTSEAGEVFLLQLTPIGTMLQNATDKGLSPVESVIDRLPEGFIVIDRDGLIQRANSAFLDLVEVASKATVVGESVSRWLWQPGADLQVLLSNIREHRSVRSFSTIVHGELGRNTDVEVSGAGDVDLEPNLVGLLLRDVTRRLAVSDGNDRFGNVLASLEERIGKVPLADLVQDTVDAVEQHHIKAALRKTEGNRTAAAELLGLSRQTLYAKLNRFGLVSSVEADQ